MGLLGPPPLKPGNSGRLWISNGWRPCIVLAVLSDRALVEYTMPKGTTALAFVDARRRSSTSIPPTYVRVTMRPCTYRFLLLPWLKAVTTQSKTLNGWVGNSSRGQVPSPGKLYLDRCAP